MDNLKISQSFSFTHTSRATANISSLKMNTSQASHEMKFKSTSFTSAFLGRSVFLEPRVEAGATKTLSSVLQTKHFELLLVCCACAFEQRMRPALVVGFHQ